MLKTIKVISVLGLLVATMACGQQRSMQQVSKMTFTPEVGGEIEWDFEYDDDNYLENIEKSIANKKVFEQELIWNDDRQLEEISVKFIDPDAALGRNNISFLYTWDKGDVVEINAQVKSAVYTQQVPNSSGFPAEFAITSKSRTDASFTYENNNLSESSEDKKIEVLQGLAGLVSRQINTANKQCLYMYMDDSRLENKECTIKAAFKSIDAAGKVYAKTNIYSSVEQLLVYGEDKELVEIKRESSIKTIVENTQAGMSPSNNSSNSSSENTEFKYDRKTAKVKRLKIAQKNGDLESDNTLDFKYDEDGRIRKIEDDRGNILEIEYEDVDKKVKGMPIALPKVFGV